MNDRLKWALGRRRRLKCSVEGFSASLLSYATADSSFTVSLQLPSPAAVLTIKMSLIEQPADHWIELKERAGAPRDRTPW